MDTEIKKVYDIVIAGAGPAGLTAALYAGRAGRSVLVVEQTAVGGQLAVTPKIENYPGVGKTSGFELCAVMKGQAEEAGAEILYAEITGLALKGKVKKIITKEGTYGARAVILCMGAASRRLGLPREDEFLGRGLSYCATCDGAFFLKRDAAVVGSGATAVRDALYLAPLAGRVTIIARENELKAPAPLAAKLKEFANITLLTNSSVISLNGGKTLSGVTVLDLKTKKEYALTADVLFIAAGRSPATGVLAEAVALDGAGYIKVKKGMAASVRGVFAAGDITDNPLKQAVTAAADGAEAAESAVKYLAE